MFIQQIDTTCFHILCSNKTTLNLGASVGVESIKKQKERKISENPNTAEKKFGRIYRKSQNRNTNAVVKVQPSLDVPSSAKNQNRAVKRKPGNHQGGKIKNRAAVKSSTKQRNTSEETKNSAKWLCYGGCLPLILRALETVNDLDEALKPWEDSLNNKERSIILKEQSSWKRALEIFEWFKKKGCYELNVIHYNIMLRILGKSQKWDLVESLWNEMETRRIIPTNSTYGTLIDVYSKGGLTEEGLLWLERMKKQGIEPDEVTMGIVVQTYKKAGEFEKAEQFFKDWSSGKMVTSGGKTTARTNDASSQSHTCFSSYTYNTLIDTYGKAGHLQEASDTFSRMLKEGIVPNTVTFNTMMHICGNHGQLEEVASLMQKMEELRCPPDTRTYNILISLHAKHDDINAAMSYFTKMKEVGLIPDPVSYRTLLYAFSIRQMVVESEALVSEMDELGLKIDEFTQSALTRMYIDAGMLQGSWSWFERFHVEGKMSLECYSANIDAYGERGHVLEAEKAFVCCKERMKLTVLEYNVMIKAYGIGKQYDKACELFDDMEKNGVLPDKCSYNSLIQILSGADLPHAAKPYVWKMQKAGLVSDCVPYCAVISSFVKLGQLEMAEQIFNEMVGFGVQPDVVVFGVLINAFADVGSVKEATRYVDAMRNAGLPGNPVIYNSLIKLYTKVGYLQEAQETYKLLQSSGAAPEVYSSNCMIDLYSERAMVTQADEIFEDLKQRGDANEFSYAMMLCMYRRIGRFDEAIAIAQKMREVGLLTDLLSYNNVIWLYASDGRLKEAVETFREMIKSSIQPDDYTFRSLGVVLVKCGASKEAVSKLEVVRRKDALSGLHAWVSTLCSIIGVDDAQKSCGKTGSVMEFDPFVGNILRYEVG
ncbi:Pentatricopeptide repeat [Macleaya cordata]|uniref:Pentatricopeptide repeat n=1 Tax=Macleaya cordata TaxID=56857 RepID=A0A200QHD4_MACCD|nr:Pentatricopeptide repeat [Macleaya cordata]